MRVRRGIIAVLVVSLLASCSLAVPIGKAAQDHFLEYSIDNYMVAITSGNLSASVPFNWPRVIFSHVKSYLSPTFDVSFEEMFLFNDTNHDGYFTRPETTYTAFFDEEYVNWDGEMGWNVSDMVFDSDPVTGESAHFNMKATVSLYAGYLDRSMETPTIADWANVTFWFSIFKNTTYFANSIGTYSVQGKTTVRTNYSLEIIKQVNSTGVVLEQLLKGGSSTYMFQVLENNGQNDSHTPVSGRIDETVFGLNYSNQLRSASTPNQEVLFSKEDGTVRAFYRFSSEPMLYKVGVLSAVPVNASYYTIGNAGMIMHTAYPLANGTGVLTHDLSLGIEESGFLAGPGDWIMDHLVLVILVAALIVLVPVSIRVFFGGRKQKLEENPEPKPRPRDEDKGQDQMERSP